MFINHHSKQVTAKIVYYGPGLSGKTTNLQYIFSVTNPKTRGELVSIETDVERTLFFDLLPINVGLLNGYQTKFQLYTVPGQVFYDSTRQLVLKGADGVVFVVDSQEVMENANLDSFENLKANLAKQSRGIDDLPLVFQYNKRDLKSILPIERLNRKLNRIAAPYYGASAIIGTGVIETLREISSMTLKKIKGLLDQNPQVKNMKPFVNFDTDQQQGIIEKNELPLKKVTGKKPEDYRTKLVSSDELKKKSLPTVDEKSNDDGDEILELTGFEEVEEVKPPQIIERTDEIPEFKGFDEVEEIKPPQIIERTDEIPEFKGFEEVEEVKPPKIIERTDEIPELKGFDEDEIQIELGEITGDQVVPVKTAKIPTVEKVPEFKEFEETEEIEKLPVVEPVKRGKELEKTALEMDIEKIELLKKPPTKFKPNDFEFLDKLRDDSRLTIIRKMILLPGPDSPMVIEMRDKSDKSLLLEPIEIKITPGVKKITVILDIK